MPNELSSDILERQFGPTELEALHQDDATRIICTKVAGTGQILELSQVTFLEAGMDEFPEVHQAVINGVSMGKAFAGHGIAFTRQTKAAYDRTLPFGFEQRFNSDKPATVVAVTILVGPEQTPYAEILETYSPAVAWPEKKGKPTGQQLAAIEALGTFLQ
jgi:hypothetical protein